MPARGDAIGEEWLAGTRARVGHLRSSAALRHQVLRFVLTGGVVAAAYLATVLVLSGPFGLPIQVAIPIGYVASLLLNYVLQRLFVFGHTDRFAHGTGAQFRRYVAVGALQYGYTAGSTAWLPGPLGVSETAVYVVAAVSAPIMTFVLLRVLVFHGKT